MARRKRVLVLESEKLLAAGIVSLLAGYPTLEVTSALVTSLASLEHSDTAGPDVVILEEGLLAANLSAVVKLADRHPSLRLIVFRLNDDKVQIFDKQMAQVGQASDFLDLL